MDRFAGWIRRIIAANRLDLALVAITHVAETPPAETVHTMNVLRRLFGNRDTERELQRHDEILEEMQAVTNQLRAGDPVTQMVRGEWKSDSGRTIIVLEPIDEKREDEHDA